MRQDLPQGHHEVAAPQRDSFARPEVRIHHEEEKRGLVEVAALHEGCPVISGEKWSTTIWSRTQPIYVTRETMQNFQQKMQEFLPESVSLGDHVVNWGFTRLKWFQWRPKRY